MDYDLASAALSAFVATVASSVSSAPSGTSIFRLVGSSGSSVGPAASKSLVLGGYRLLKFKF